MSDADLAILKEFRANLHEAREVVLRLRKRLATVEAMYRERKDDLRDLVAALELVANNGGKSIPDPTSPDRDPIVCTGSWCSEQAHSALDSFRSKPVHTFTLIEWND